MDVAQVQQFFHLVITAKTYQIFQLTKLRPPRKQRRLLLYRLS